MENLKARLAQLAVELHNAVAAPTAAGYIDPARISGIAVQLEQLSAAVGEKPVASQEPSAPPPPAPVPHEPEPSPPPSAPDEEPPEEEHPDEEHPAASKKKLVAVG